MSRRIEYESQPCTRCLGSGRYSYNPMDGDRCYGCGGSGKRLTKNGAAASKKVKEFMAEMLSAPAGSFSVGDRVRNDRGRYVSITAIEPYGDTGQISVTFKDSTVFGYSEIGHVLQPESPLRKAPSPEQWDQIFAFASKYKGATIVVSEPPAADMLVSNAGGSGEKEGSA